MIEQSSLYIVSEENFWFHMKKQPQRYLMQKGVLKNFANFTEKHLVFSCEICKIFKNTYFEEHLRRIASASRCKFYFRVIPDKILVVFE